MIMVENGVAREMTPQEIVEFEASRTPPVPYAISKMQAIFALKWTGLYDDFTTALAAAGPTAQDYVDLASHWHRDHDLVNQMAGALGLSQAQVDDLFRTAVLFE